MPEPGQSKLVAVSIAWISLIGFALPTAAAPPQGAGLRPAGPAAKVSMQAYYPNEAPAALAALNQAQKLRLQLKSEAALTLLNEAVLRFPKSIACRDYRSDLEREFGDMKAAMADIQKILQLAPGNVNYTKKRAKIYDITGQLKEAIADYDYVLTKEPKTFSAWRDRAIAHKRLKEYGPAARDFDMAVTLSDRDNHYNDLLYDRSQMYLFSGNTAKAMDGANVLIKEFPHMSKGLWMRAQVYDKLNQPGPAKADRDKAKILDENFDPVEKF